MSHDHHGHHAVKEPVGWMDRPDKVRLFFRVFYAICGVLLVAAGFRLQPKTVGENQQCFDSLLLRGRVVDELRREFVQAQQRLLELA